MLSDGQDTDFKPATAHTAKRNRDAVSGLPAPAPKDFAAARRGFLGTLPDAEIRTDAGDAVVWSLRPYAFLDTETPPDSVHPSLWRQARLNCIHGLFEVTPGIYQVRGFDLANMTIVEGETGIIVIDTLVTVETARAALALYRQHRGDRPVVAVIYTHCHGDHFAGVRGVIDDEQAARIPIIAPEHFLYEAISENMFAGPAMARRALYFSGAVLPRGPRGQVDAGLGKSVSVGSVSLLAPNDIIRATGETRRIDGVDIVFQMAPDTEAPAEMLLHFPQFRALCGSEVACPLMHNIYTPRGAPVRNARNWWRVLNEAVELFGEATDVLFVQHHWPRWGRESIVAYLQEQRDLYKCLHDQTLRLANNGFTPVEIAEELRLPAPLTGQWHLREYYGTASHNAKGIYQRYLGWYDGNPANLHPLPPEDSGRRYVEAMGGIAAVLNVARQAFDNGEYRWVAQLMNHAVFAAPDHPDVRALQADALEQLGYLSESAVWRNMYLMGALELRSGIKSWGKRKVDRSDYVRAMPVQLMLDYMGILLDGTRAAAKRIAVNLTIRDTGEIFFLELSRGALVYSEIARPRPADVGVSLTRAELSALVNSANRDAEALAALEVSGDRDRFAELLSCLGSFKADFALVEP